MDADGEALRDLDVSTITGCVHGCDEGATAYFGHFCALLHIEYLTEVERIRHRLTHRSGQLLQRGGWTVLDARALEVHATLVKDKSKGQGKSNGKGKGKGIVANDDADTNKVIRIVLNLPSDINIERLRFKKGDNVMLSRSSLLCDKLLVQGQLQVLNSKRAEVLLDVGAVLPDSWKDQTLRIDRGPNRFSYVRQLASLVKLCSSEEQCRRNSRPHFSQTPAAPLRPPIFELLTSAKVGEIDLWGKRREASSQANASKNPAATDKSASKDAAKGGEAISFCRGDAVVLVGLQRSEFNYLHGEVVSDAGAGPAESRVGVRLQGSEKVCMVKPENLLRQEDGAVENAVTTLIEKTVVLNDKAAGRHDASAAASSFDSTVCAVADAVTGTASSTVVAGPTLSVSADPPVVDACLTDATEIITDSDTAASMVERLASESSEQSADNLAEWNADLEATAGLNDSQRTAVHAAVRRWCTAIQGPPGTGKTTTAVNTLRLWVKAGFRPLMATAEGNVAVDNIAEGLMRHGIKVLRIGRPENVQNSLKAVTFDEQLKHLDIQAEQTRREEMAARRTEACASRINELERLSVAELRLRAQKVDSFSADQGFELIDGKDEPKLGVAEATDTISTFDRLLKVVARAEVAMEEKAVEDEEAARLAARSPEEVAFVERSRIRHKKDQVLRSADVICTQLISAGGPLLAPLGRFEGVLIDEVAQATELTAIVPLVQRCARRTVLVGDHCQLPPMVQSSEAEARGHSLSLFSRLVGQGLRAFLLDTQFRSHPKLAEFSATEIYSGKLQSGISESMRQRITGFQWPRKNVPVAFVESGREARESAEGESRFNEWEADRVLEIVIGVLDAGGCTVRDAGIVTPYMAQVRLLRRKWREICKERADGESARSQNKTTGVEKRSRDQSVGDGTSVAGDPDENGVPRCGGSASVEACTLAWWKQTSDLEIASVDHFQGREKDLVVFSAVRNNGAGRIGFLSDWRRLNVMLTRARRGLVVVGNAWTLRNDTFWRKWLAWCAAHNVIVDRVAFHRIIKYAIRKVSGSPPGPRQILHSLFDYDLAPRTQKSFMSWARAIVDDANIEDEDLRVAWGALVAARAKEESSTATAAQSVEASAAMIVADDSKHATGADQNSLVQPGVADCTSMAGSKRKLHCASEVGADGTVDGLTSRKKKKQKVAHTDSPMRAGAVGPEPCAEKVAVTEYVEQPPSVAVKRKKKRKAKTVSASAIPVEDGLQESEHEVAEKKAK
eukprot:TRINITY_DN38339_c0_g1_i1.p1 TRINITY_DN38339_c0_g1~~TRINITY_DN38339_c0_g1_i1.p1  ORF type:complete len:1295 (+),score=223.13 TRINITY_DN38339_c0_g1_i1:147-3887(+)